MASICGPHGLQVSRPERLRFHQSGTVLRSMATTLGFVEYGTDVTVAVRENSPLNCYSVSLPMVGQQELAAHGKTWLSDQDCGLIVSPQESQDLAITGNCRKLHVAIPRAALQQVLQTMLQRPLDAPLVFHPTWTRRPASRARGGAWSSFSPARWNARGRSGSSICRANSN
ncbi:hypothetical protein [Paraburkholderia sp. Ac-20342]|uniref:cupin domain-containing protein n=1 Tax=Paraburkholderia sp. Ac-20342 TaxID=2703889 RepID=UPI001F11BD31|nr:hypothetical protein [Paraburkholderia sp. Ac-20342]